MLLLTKAIHKLSCPGSAPVMLMDEPVTQPAPKVGCDKHGQVGGCFGTSHLCQVGVKHLQTCATTIQGSRSGTNRGWPGQELRNARLAVLTLSK